MAKGSGGIHLDVATWAKNLLLLSVFQVVNLNTELGIASLSGY